MSADVQQIRTIHMTVQTAEKRLLGYKAEAELNLSCTLVNIARGNCSVSIYPIADIATPSGELEIEIRRPVMNLALISSKPPLISCAKLYHITSRDLST